ncbi:MAG: hypothetical protein Q4E05_08760 [Pseudoclavibacter sp.]|nr:hypothetical protein [Pseudoclavibacter sp.]
MPRLHPLSRRRGALGLLAGLCLAATMLPGPAQAAPPDPGASSSSRLVDPGEGLRLDSPEFARLYGPGVFTMTALGNTVVGRSQAGYERLVSNRFRATEGGELASLRLYWPTGSGYSGGTGGRMRLSVLPDDGSPEHRPVLDAQPLAIAHYEPKLVDGEKPPKIVDGKEQRPDPLLAELPVEGEAAPLVPGQLYHVVLENLDPDSVRNFISSDNSITHRENGRPARWLNTVDWATLIAYRPADRPGTAFTWRDLTLNGSGHNIFSPIMELTTRDGRKQGVFDMESGSVDPERIFTVDRDSPVRERFTPSSDKRVSGLSVATAAAVPGALRWSLLHGEQVLASGVIEQQNANYAPHEEPKNIIGNYFWYDVELPRDVVMRAGQSYDLVLRAEGDSQWRIGDHSNGSHYEVPWPAAFTESQAQHLHGGRWINTNHWNHTASGTGTNWPVVLHLAP